MRCAGLALAAGLLLAGCGRSPAASAYAAAREALRTGDLERAEREVEAAARLGGERFEALRAFLRGNVAYARLQAVEPQAEAGDADAAKAALKHAEDALAYWRWAARSRADWPAAGRNVERALLALARLRERRGSREREPPAPPEPVKPEEAAPQPPSRIETSDLSGAEVLGLFERLARREREKIELRRRQRATHPGRAERDW